MLAYRGFWVKQGLEPWMCGIVHHIVVDSASIEVNRRHNRSFDTPVEIENHLAGLRRRPDGRRG